MSKYKFDVQDLRRRTYRRMSFELAFLALVSIVFWSDISGSISLEMKLSILGVVGAYIAFGAILALRARSYSASLTINLNERGLELLSDAKTLSLPYSDLSIAKVRWKHGSPLEIRVRTRFRQTIKFRGLQDMRQFYEELRGHLDP